MATGESPSPSSSLPSSRKRPRPPSASASDLHLRQSDQARASEFDPELSLRLQCCYRSKLCLAQRAMKQNGEYHKLCEYHRRRANLNQQRVHQRRKIRMKQIEGQASLSSSAASSPRTKADGIRDAAGAFSSADESHYEAEVWRVLEPYASPCGDLPVCDLIILEALLFSCSPPPSPRRGERYAPSSPTVSLYTNGTQREV